MSERAIQRLRLKIILVTMMTLMLVMVFIGTVINAVSLVATTMAIRSTLVRISGNDGMIVEDMESFRSERRKLPSVIDAYSNNTYRHNHFFIMYMDENGEMTGFVSNTENEYEISLITDSAEDLMNLPHDFGRFGTYYYLKSDTEDGGKECAVIDCTSEISTMMRLLYATAITISVTLIITFFLVLILSGRMVRPEIENSRRQKQFITNASHELKTPLSVIRANTELLELTHGQDEWTQSTLRQVDHMNGLIQNLVLIAKAEEREDKSILSRIDASAAVEESAKSFEPLARQSGKELVCNITPELFIIMDESKLRQLTTLLVDNAIKYCDEGGRVTVLLTPAKRNKKCIRLDVSNSYKDGGNIDCERFFDRFYREDSSHNIDSGSYGIGLSIAESICRQNGGRINAAWKDGVITFTCQLV